MISPNELRPRMIEVTVEVVRPNPADILRSNRSYYAWIRTQREQVAYAAAVGRVAELVDALPPSGTRITVPMMEIGGQSIVFSPYTAELPFGPNADPVNLFFWNNGSASRVCNLMRNNLTPNWKRTRFRFECASVNYLMFYDKITKLCSWTKGAHSSSPEGCALTRFHIRLFDGGKDNDLGRVCVGSVHHEHFDITVPNHIPDDYDGGQGLVAGQFVAKSFTKSIIRGRFQRGPERIRNVRHDGEADMVEVS